MFRKLVWVTMIAAFVLLTSVAYAQDTTEASLRVLQAVNDNTSVTLTLQDGRTILSNVFPGSVSDYFSYDLTARR